jgi:hypothetical protein
MLNLFSLRIQGTKTRQERIRNEKVMAPKVGGSRTQNNKPQSVIEHPKHSYYVAMLLL